MQKHKTSNRTGKPLVVPIVEQLRAILEDARRRTPGSRVVAYRGRPLKSIRGGLALAAERAGLVYGRDAVDGVTFHTIRHTMATLLAEQTEIGESMRRELMGHESIATTQLYTHIRPLPQRAPLEQLSAGVPIQDLVTAPRQRASAKMLPGRFGARKKAG